MRDNIVAPIEQNLAGTTDLQTFNSTDPARTGDDLRDLRAFGRRTRRRISHSTQKDGPVGGESSCRRTSRRRRSRSATHRSRRSSRSAFFSKTLSAGAALALRRQRDRAAVRTDRGRLVSRASAATSRPPTKSGRSEQTRRLGSHAQRRDRHRRRTTTRACPAASPTSRTARRRSTSAATSRDIATSRGCRSRPTADVDDGDRQRRFHRERRRCTGLGVGALPGHGRSVDRERCRAPHPRRRERRSTAIEPRRQYAQIDGKPGPLLADSEGLERRLRGRLGRIAVLAAICRSCARSFRASNSSRERCSRRSRSSRSNS